jgi:hypothetical protein
VLGLAEGLLGRVNADGVRRSVALEDLDLRPRCVERVGSVSEKRCRASSPPQRRIADGTPALADRPLGRADLCLGDAQWFEEGLGMSPGLVQRAARGSDRVVGADTRHLAGGVAALDDGGNVGAVVCEYAFEHVTRGSVVGVVGDDEEPVHLPAAGSADVEAAVAGGLGDDGDADVDGIGLVAVGGGGVAEPDVLAGAVGAQGGTAVSVEVRHGEAAVGVDGDDGPAVSVAADRWITERAGLRPRTVELYGWLLGRHIAPWLGAVPLERIDTPLVREWRAKLLAEGVSPSTTAKAYRLLRSVLMTAVNEDRIIPRNPCQVRGADKEHRTERPVLSTTQVVALADSVPARYRAMILLTTFASLRFGEVTALQRPTST